LIGSNIPQWLVNIRYDSSLDYCFNVDHPFRIGKKSFVFYPYDFDVKQIEPFRLELLRKGFELEWYPYSEYGKGTYKIVIRDGFEKYESFKEDFEKIEAIVKGNEEYWKWRHRRDK